MLGDAMHLGPAARPIIHSGSLNHEGRPLWQGSSQGPVEASWREASVRLDSGMMCWIGKDCEDGLCRCADAFRHHSIQPGSRYAMNPCPTVASNMYWSAKVGWAKTGASPEPSVARM